MKYSSKRALFYFNIFVLLLLLNLFKTIRKLCAEFFGLSYLKFDSDVKCKIFEPKPKTKAEKKSPHIHTRTTKSS